LFILKNPVQYLGTTSVWKAKGEEILAKIKRAREKLSGN
jgi:hypothetical protein